MTVTEGRQEDIRSTVIVLGEVLRVAYILIRIVNKSNKGRK